MKNIIENAPSVANNFFELTKSITEFADVIDPKTKELILIGIFTASGGLRGIETHVKRALDIGASKNEILGSILFALPVVGISNITLSMEKALSIIAGEISDENN